MSLIRTATVFGSTGFLGHAITQALVREGFLVRASVRHMERAKTLRMLGEPGQVVPFLCPFDHDVDVASAIGNSSTVINLIGILAERGNTTFQNIHVALAARIARIAREQGARNLLHVSALGADLESHSRYASSKAAGEEAVRAFFPGAIIFRPGIMFGPDDRFFNRFANQTRFSPFLLLIGRGKTKFQPVYVGDVAKAAMAALADYRLQGQTFELGGPEVFTFRDMLELMLKTMRKRRWFINLPWGVAKGLAAILEHFPNPPLTRDQVVLLKTDNVTHNRNARVLQNFGIAPMELEAWLQVFCGSYAVEP